MKIKFAGTLAMVTMLLGPVAVYATDTSTDNTGQYLSDAAITVKVKAAFAEDKWVKGRHISVRTDHGVVDLTGTVDNQRESDRATALATKVESVRAVHNNLRIARH